MNIKSSIIASLMFLVGALHAQIPEYKTALVQYQAGKYSESLTTIRSVFDVNKSSLELRLLAAANYIKQGNYGSARDHLHFCIKDHPKAYQPRLYLASMYRKSGRTNLALSTAKKALSKTGDSVHVRLELAAIYLVLKRPAKSRLHIAKALILSPKNFNVIYMDGLSYLQEGNLDNAEFRFRNALHLSIPSKKNLADLYLNLGFIQEKRADKYKQIGKVKEAVLGFMDARKLYKKAIKINPKDIKIIHALKTLDHKIDE